ncbi:LacI family DNA-binding transcriptional regulator [Propionibacteriaceae bacterium Y2011]
MGVDERTMVTKGPTLKDVAEHAGVSVATASRALQGNQPIAPETRERVLASVDALGYRLLRQRREPARETPRVVVLAPSPRHLAVAEIIASVEAVTADAEHLCTFAVTESNPEREIRALDTLTRSLDVAAVVVVGGTNPTQEWRTEVPRRIRTLTDRGVRVVFCGRGLPEIEVAEVAVIDYENRAGGEAAVSQLLGKGHRRIGLLRGPVGFSTSDERSRGYEDAFRSFGVDIDPALIMAGGRSGPDAAGRADELLQDHPDVTAIFADSDAQAMGALRAAHVRGVTVPDQLSVIGFDDEQQSAMLIPALTTVHTPFTELGRRAAQAALGTDPELEPGHRLTLASHVVVRESVAPNRPH